MLAGANVKSSFDERTHYLPTYDLAFQMDIDSILTGLTNRCQSALRNPSFVKEGYLS